MKWKRLLSWVLCGVLVESMVIGGCAVGNQQTVSTAEDVSALIASRWQENYYGEVTVDLSAGEVKADGQETTLTEVLPLTEREADQAMTSAEALKEACQQLGYETETTGEQVTITDPYQTCRLVVQSDELPDRCGAAEVLWFQAAGEYILQFDTEEETRQAYETLSQRYDCYPDSVVSGSTLLEGDDQVVDCFTYGASLMGLDYLKWDAAWYGIQNTVTVAVIDTGVDESNEMFEGRTISPLSYSVVTNDNDITDISGHGTHVCGILADCTTSNVELLVIKAFGENGSATMLSLESAIYYAIDCGADVINMSCGFEYDQAYEYTFLDTAISTAYNAGIVICAAAGNKGVNVTGCYPACNEQTISVGAINLNWLRWSMSDTGALLDFVAPGVQILSAQQGGSLVTKTGTSMAAPHLAAAVAMIKLIHPDYTVPMLYATLQKYAVDLGEPGRDDEYGYGCVNLKDYYEEEEARGSLRDYQVKNWVNPFGDVTSDKWYYNSVRYAAFHGLFSGTGTDTFSPEQGMTRGMMVTVLWRMAGQPTTWSGEDPFTDVKSTAYYATAVRWAKENSIVSGVSDDLFDPDSLVTREQFATILYRYAARWLGISTNSYASLAAFPDSGSASRYSTEALQWAVAIGILSGSQENGVRYLLPKNSTTRAQAAQMLMSFKELTFS